MEKTRTDEASILRRPLSLLATSTVIGGALPHVGQKVFASEAETLQIDN